MYAFLPSIIKGKYNSLHKILYNILHQLLIATLKIIFFILQLQIFNTKKHFQVLKQLTLVWC